MGGAGGNPGRCAAAVRNGRYARLRKTAAKVSGCGYKVVAGRLSFRESRVGASCRRCNRVWACRLLPAIPGRCVRFCAAAVAGMLPCGCFWVKKRLRGCRAAIARRCYETVAARLLFGEDAGGRNEYPQSANRPFILDNIISGESRDKTRLVSTRRIGRCIFPVACRDKACLVSTRRIR